MGIDRNLGTGDAGDAAFGRWLLDSAKGDLVEPAQVRAAWTRFAEAAGAVAVAHRAAARGDLGATVARRAGIRALWAGVVGGGVITAAWLGHHHLGSPSANASPEEPMPARVEPAPSTPLVALTARAEPEPARAAPHLYANCPKSRDVARIAETEQAMAPGATTDTTPTPPLPPPPTSTLAAEIIALDETRADIATGDFSAALRTVETYQRDFAHGQLAADAEALAIEAVAGQGDHAEAARRAAQFLLHHPNDPHASRLRRLAAW
jgi:hypothetical protein